MNAAPLSLFLTHFAALPPPVEDVELLEFGDDLPELEATVTLSVADLEAQVEAAAQGARSDSEQRYEAETATLIATHEAAAAEALTAARAEWVESASESLMTSLDGAMATLRTMLSERIANVLRPLLAEAAVARTKAELLDALDRLLADPTQPTLCVRGPEDLGAALRAVRPDAGIEWVVADTIEVAIVADATRIETKLAAALADLAATEI